MARIGRTLLLFAVAAAWAAPGAEAAPPPTLSGEGFAYGSFYDYFGSGPAISCTDDSDGGATVRLRFGGSSGPGGPYVGPWSDVVDVKLGEIGIGERKVLGVSGDLTVNAPSGQITAALKVDGSATGPESNVAAVDCSPGNPGPAVGYLFADMLYTATIVTPDGVFVDRGRSRFSVSAYNARQRWYDVSHRFTSDLTAPEQNETALFGQRVPGGSFSAMSANTKRASPFTLWVPATVRKVYAYIDGGGASSGSQTLRAVLYRNAGGQPAGYVTRSFDVAVPAGRSARWQPFYLAPTAQLGPGVYWLGLQSGGANGVARFAWNSKASSRRFNIDGFGDGASDPFGAALVDDQQLSIFAAGSR